MKARTKNRIRNTLGTMNRFGSILLIVALGSGFLAGLLSTSPDMYESADRYYDDNRWYDLDIKGLLGITEEDAEEIAARSEAAEVQAVRVYDMVLQAPDETLYTTRVFALRDGSGREGLNRYELLEGHYPEKRNECIAQVVGGRYDGGSIGVGSVLTYREEETDEEAVTKALTERKLTVTGICRSPMSVSVEADLSTVGGGSVMLVLYAPEALFEGESWTDLFIALEGAEKLNTFGTEYEALRDKAVAALEPVAEERGRLRAGTVRKEAEDSIAKAAQLTAVLEKANDREQALEKAAEESRGIHREAEKMLAKTAGEDAAKVFGAAEPAGNEAGTSAAKEGKAAGNEAGTSAAEEGKAAGNEAGTSAAGNGQDGWTREKEIPLLASLREQIDQGRETLDSLPEKNWLIRTRNDSMGFVSYSGNVEKVFALSKVFPVFFFLVALLVALTTMTRLIEENRAQIGTLKSIGYSDRNIWGEYMIYALSASVLGCVFGFAVGFRLFPWVISNAYGMMYTLPETQTPFRADIALGVAPITIGGILLAAFIACRGELNAQPAALLIPKAPRPGKRILLERIGFIWKRLNFTGKVTFRNLFRYKKRFIMTVIGVAGCSALLLTGFGIRDSIHDIVEKQFGQVYHYELTLALDDAAAVWEDPVLKAFLEDERYTSGWMPCASVSGKVRFGSKVYSATLNVPERTEDLSAYVSLRERVSGKELALTEESVVLTEKLCEQMGIRCGDKVILEDAGGEQVEMTVTGITENYLTSFAYLTAEAWEKGFGSGADFTTVLCLKGTESENVTAEAMKSRHVVLARDTAGLKSAFADSVKSIDAIVVVLIISAGLLSIVVLYNLINVNICERRKELATIEVLGFFPRETQRYIFRETNLLSLIGSLVGLGVGVWLHKFVVRTVEVEAVMFGRSIHFPSYLYALAISAVFTLLVNQMMKKQIRRVDMVEAMKTND